jgi:hypothetical protein
LVRLPVVCSILAHGLFLLVALKLPTARSHAARTITVEIRESKPAHVAAAVPRPPSPQPSPIKHAPAPSRSEPKLAPQPLPPQKPERVEERPATTGSSLSMRAPATVDLNLHDLSGVVVNRGEPSTGTIASAPRKPWKPRGDAGDPILGRVAEEKEERFPLSLESDGYHYKGPAFSAKIAMDGSVSFNDHSIRDFKGLSGSFDITELAMKGRHQDPYRYEKEKFMESTNKLRAELQSRARKEALESSLQRLPSHLEAIWADGTRPAHERRRALYVVWREASGTDDEVGAAGKKARATVEAFIRERLPLGSADAYSDEELKRYNARTAVIKFDPYRE